VRLCISRPDPFTPVDFGPGIVVSIVRKMR
jgi:hypothetical protein